MSASEQASEAEIWQRWPLHVLVWKDDPKALEALIQEKQVGHIHICTHAQVTCWSLKM